MSYITIAFEGIDGSGKGVQFTRLKEKFESMGLKVGTMDFPQYDSFFGNEIGILLSGKNKTTAATVDPKSMALWYAMDRFMAYRDNPPANDCDVVLLNRSSLANAAYQGTRIDDEERNVFLKWIFDLEFVQLNIPKPDLFFLFDIPIETSINNVAKKGHRDYVGDNADVYEKDLKYLDSVRKSYLACAEIMDNIIKIDCTDGTVNMRSIEDIHNTVLNTILEKFPNLC
ncbi:MAG: hypothetical protein E7385_04560 [Ruminococcaceae bacterium]|nr:hypothetical protein [Oscillospiraceae bacterium]